MNLVSLWSDEDEGARSRFVTALDAEDLLEALFAIEGASQAKRDVARSCIVGWAGRVSSFIEGGLSPAAALGETLTNEAGFHGDKEDYFAAANSEITNVVERRCGLPILLSAVWMIVGGTAGRVVEPIGLPGHFVARVEGTYVDPFNEGRELTAEGCRALVATVTRGQVPWSDDLLEPISMSAMLERVLRNLMREHGRNGDGPALFRLATFLREVRPNDPGVHLSRADLAAKLGDRVENRAALTTVVQRFPGSEAAELASGRLAALGAPN